MKKNELPKEMNECIDEYIKTHSVKNMADMEAMNRMTVLRWELQSKIYITNF